MSFTRFHDDPNRIQKTNLETSAINDYTFNVPNSVNSKSVFFTDPHLRMQKNGTTLCRNMVDVESELFTMNRTLCRDNINRNNYIEKQDYKVYIHTKNITKTITKQPRSSHPAWMLRGTGIDRSEYLLSDPQKNVIIPFQSYLDTNILEKDYYNLNDCKKI